MARNRYDVDETLEKDAEFNIKHLIRLGQYVKPYRGDIAKTVAMMLLSSLIGLVPPLLFSYALDVAIPQKSIPLILLLSLFVLVAAGLGAYFLRYRIHKMTRVGQGIVRDLRLHLFTHLQELPFTYYDSRPHGKILVRVVNYVNSLSDLLSNGIVNLVTDMFSLIVILVVMLCLNIRLTLVSLAGLPFLLLATNIIKTYQRRAWRIQSAKMSNMNAYIHESIAGVRITQAFTREQYNMNIFQTIAGQVRATWLQAIRIMFCMGPAAENISVWTMAALYVCGVMWLSGGTVDAAGVTLGTLVAFISLNGRFWGPINNIANLYNSMVINMTYLERIFEAIDEPVIVHDIEGAVLMRPIEGKVAFDHVSFSYEEGQKILNDVSFVAERGETIALVGPTGAGKTTVVNLISRFYDVDSGRVLIDGVDIHGVTLQSLRSQMGIMLQDSFIFSGTIMDNIRYGRLDATDEEVMEAAKTVCAHDFIITMKEGYQTEVNERGNSLSIGQRQLISFARALLADPKILILDEATSSIDTETEMALQQGLNRLLKGRTSFIIAHRLSTIKNADKIMYVDKGTIVEAGNHDELMALGGAYHDLYTAQFAFLDVS